MELVSVIITTYKRDYSVVRRAIESVLKQTYSHLEIILVDDNADNSVFSQNIMDGIKEYGDEVTYLSYQGNRGACYARNYGAKYSKGDYIAFLDDDDEWHSDKIETQMKELSDPLVIMVSCNAEYLNVGKDGTVSKKYIKRKTEHHYITLEELLIQNVIGGCSVPLIRKEAFLKVGQFMVDLPAAQDYDLWLRLIQIGKIRHLDNVLLNYYVHQFESITGNADNKIRGYEHIIGTYADLASDKREFLAYKYYKLAKVCFNTGHYSKGIHYCKFCLKNKSTPAYIAKTAALVTKGFVKRICRSFRNNMQK